jgi:hypothetical protein
VAQKFVKTSKNISVLVIILMVVSSAYSVAYVPSTAISYHSERDHSTLAQNYSIDRTDVLESRNDISIIPDIDIDSAVANNTTSSGVAFNSSDTKEDMEVMQKPVIGHFKGTFHQDLGASCRPGCSTSGNLDGTMEGYLISDDGIHYIPNGTWHVSFDWNHFTDGVLQGSHSYSGPATTPTILPATDPHYVTVTPGWNHLVFDPASSTFSNSLTAQDSEPGCCLQIFIPLLTGGPKALSGSDASGEVTTSWTFTPTINRPPVAVATADKTEVVSLDTVTLDGSQSHDPDPGDSIASYEWKQISPPDGVIGSSATVGFTAPQVDSPTTFTFGLSVSDTYGDIGDATVDVVVKPPLCPPDAFNNNGYRTTVDPIRTQVDDRCPPPCTDKELNRFLKFIPETGFREISYPIKGANSLQEAGLKFKFVTDDGKPAAAAKTSIEWTFKYVLDNKGKVGCKSKVTVLVTTEMPRWNDVKRLDPIVQEEWKRFLAALRVHEHVHTKLFHDQFKGIATKIIGKTLDEAIKILEDTANNLDNHKEYDLNTDHGCTEGAILDFNPGPPLPPCRSGR